MKMVISIAIATALLSGIYGAATSSVNDMISPVGTTIISTVFGAGVGVLLGAIALGIKKIIG